MSAKVLCVVRVAASLRDDYPGFRFRSFLEPNKRSEPNKSSQAVSCDDEIKQEFFYAFLHNHLTSEESDFPLLMGT
jgi:hypothetical protein